MDLISTASESLSNRVMQLLFSPISGTMKSITAFNSKCGQWLIAAVHYSLNSSGNG